MEPARFRRGQLPARRRPALRRRSRHGHDGRAAGGLPRRGAGRARRAGAGGAVLADRRSAAARRRSSTGRPARARCWCAAATRASTSASSTRASRTRSAWAISCSRAARSPAMALLDAVARLQPGVLGDEASHAQDSFNPALDGLLDCPHYTRPEEWRGAGRAAPSCCRAITPRSSAGGATSGSRSPREQRPELIEAARAAGRLERGGREGARKKAIILGFPILCPAASPRPSRSARRLLCSAGTIECRKP